MALNGLQSVLQTAGANGIQAVTQMGALTKPASAEAADVADFGSVLANALNEINDLQMNAGRLNSDFVEGKTDNIHQVMIAAEEASISLQLGMEVRNKVLDAYQEIMRMSI